jgi:hypothetical protein
MAFTLEDDLDDLDTGWHLAAHGLGLCGLSRKATDFAHELLISAIGNDCVYVVLRMRV